MNRYFDSQAGGAADDLGSLNQYYASQAGGSLDAFQGYEYYNGQKGNGFFGRILKSGLLPLLKKIGPYLGKKALSTVTGVASEMTAGQPIGSALKRTIKRVGSSVAKDVSNYLDEGQEGTGRKRRRMRKKMNPGLRAIALARKLKSIKGKKGRRKPIRKTKRRRRGKKRTGRKRTANTDLLF